MPSFLLDANLSPRTARFLSERFGFDVRVLRGDHQHRLPDHEVIRMTRAEGRIIVTLNRDFAEYFFRASSPAVGITYLDLSNTHRFIPDINRILERFFISLETDHSVEHAFVILTDMTARIERR